LGPTKGWKFIDYMSCYHPLQITLLNIYNNNDDNNKSISIPLQQQQQQQQQQLLVLGRTRIRGVDNIKMDLRET
jgi:hypothetical protein